MDAGYRLVDDAQVLWEAFAAIHNKAGLAGALEIPMESFNGPEYISETTKTWAAKHGIEIAFIQPGQPQQNAYVERYNRTVRYDWLAHHLFDSLDEIQDFATRWLWTYNHDRPHMALGGITPIQKLALAA